MPELPEAENIGRALKRVLPGRTIRRVEIFSPAMRSSLEPLLSAGLEGRMFTGVRRRARYLIADLDDDRGLLMHFGMSGVVRVESADVPKRKHEHVFIHLDDGRIFRFECTRRFSLLEVHRLEGHGKLPAKLAGLGPEPFDENLSAEYLFQKAAEREVCIKNFIMDNAVVTGIGNIYAAESLFAAELHPMRSAKSLTKEEWEKFIICCRRILNRAIELGGSSISDFLNVDGSEGKFAQELKVYARAGLPCTKCGHILENIKISGRSSCFCPECQKMRNFKQLSQKKNAGLKILFFFFLFLFCGCVGVQKNAPAAPQTPFPAEKVLDTRRSKEAEKLAQNYINAMNLALKTGEFDHLAKVLPRRLVSARAKEIFFAMRKALEKYGKCESCTFYGALNCTFYVDFLWKYRFVKPTGNEKIPEQTMEMLYRIRVIHPEQDPVIIKADFLLR